VADLILALNAGSSTLKFALFEVGAERPVARWRGLIDAPGDGPEGHAADILRQAEDHIGQDRLRAFSHRIAHGGPDFAGPALLTAPALARLDALLPLAPLHQPHNLAMARAVATLRPDLPNIGCFDTAFFHGLPAAARRVPLPPEWEARGVRRYGFHGLSYAYLQQRLGELEPQGGPRRVIFAHLGSGASLCACLDGAPVETTMGFSPLDGLVMSTRCGALDPGVVLYMLQGGGLTAGEVQDLLYRRSGLLALSGLSGDMRTLLASDAAASQEAVDMFVFRIVREIGALTACLGGLDALVFSAGIGEHAPDIRRRVCERLAWLGVEIDEVANAAGAVRISPARSSTSVWVVPTDEEHTLAAEAHRLLSGA
jgi:acetate kinase